MSDLLERTTYTPPLHEIGPMPPIEHPPEEETGAAPWPRRAKIAVAILAAATLFGVLGTIIAATTGDGSDETAEAQIQQLTDERDALQVEQQDLTDQLDAQTVVATELAADLEARDGRIADLDQQIADLESDLGTTGTELAALRSQRDALVAERADLVTSLDATSAAIADLEAQLAIKADETAALDERITALGADVDALLDRAKSAEAERDELAAMFPMKVDTTLDPGDVTGTWDLTWGRHYCEGFTSCVNDPGFDEIEIRTIADGTLQVEIDGHFVAGLGRADGALTAVGQSTAALPTCDGSPRLANVSLTIYGLEMTATANGSQTVAQLGATVTVDAPATATCPGGVQVFGATLS